MIRILSTLVFSFALTVSAFTTQATPIDTYEFQSVDHQKRALTLANELRCPQCQNQNLIDSNSPVAQDLRLEVYKMVDAGKSDDEIIRFMTTRYGDFVLYKPRMESKTYILWIGPIALLVFGLLAALFFVRRQKTQVEAVAELSDDEQKQLDEILKRSQSK